jgi:hypothetical protein
MQTAQQGGARHSEQTKLRALAHYASSGSPLETSRATGLPESTIRTWVGTDEGSELIASVRLTLRHAIAADLVTVSRKAIAATLDRLDNGDEVTTGNGDKVRRKVSAKDAMYIASNANSMHMMLTQDAKQIAGANLKALAADLIDALKSADAVSNARTIEADAQPIEADAKPKRKSRKAQVGEGG